ncbi:hypothetical protein KIPE111705_14000 [Kibdelosporangium persicum]
MPPLPSSTACPDDWTELVDYIEVFRRTRR